MLQTGAMSMNIGKILSRKPVTVLASEPLSSAARLMCDRHVGALVVVSEPAERPTPVGDLMMLNVERAMTRDPLLLGLETPLESAVEQLRARGVRRCPVVDARGGLVGMVTTDDILTALAIELGGLARLIRDQPLHEPELGRRAEPLHSASMPAPPHPGGRA
jgi:CBS domain-containing protein